MAADAVVRDVRLYVYRRAAETTRVPQAPEIAYALNRPLAEIQDAIGQLAAGRALILAANSDNIWVAPPFCAVLSGFRVDAGGSTYQAICIWDALGVAAALGTSAVIRTSCGDCCEPMTVAIGEVRGSLGVLPHERGSHGIIHFAIPALRWWDNIGFT